jgi:DNA-binding response OmpR family regulator
MRTILIIDDDDNLREVIAVMLAERGYVVQQARDGDEGLQLFRAAPADLVLTDLMMPNKAGIATVLELRRQLPQLGIIAMSAYLHTDAPHYPKLAATLGVTRTLPKPFELSKLFQLIEEVLAENCGAQPCP